MKTEPWWICDRCKKPVIRTKKKHVKQTMLDHRKTCHENAMFFMKQVAQQSNTEE